jgi:exosortase family protein XrtM
MNLDTATCGLSCCHGYHAHRMTTTIATRTTRAATPLRFALTFILCFAALFAGFEASRGSPFERFVVEDLILVPTTMLIDRITPSEHAELTSGRVIASPGANLHVTRGCEGIEMFLLLVSGIVAFPASAGRRVQGLLQGCLLAYTLSIARLMALHYILRYSPDAWEALHGLVLPLAPIILMGLFFMHWSGRAVHAA